MIVESHSMTQIVLCVLLPTYYPFITADLINTLLNPFLLYIEAILLAKAEQEMETWLIILTSIFIAFICKFIFNLFSPSTATAKIKPNLPPGPLNIPFLSNFLWSRKSYKELEPLLRNLHAKYGPIVNLPIGSSPSIFIASREIAHDALIQSGSDFASRPQSAHTINKISKGHQSITLAPYGPTWRLLRRNLTSNILQPSRAKSYTPARKRAWKILLDSFNSKLSETGEKTVISNVGDHFYHVMFSLLVSMCFGNEVPESKIRDIKTAQFALILSYNRFKILGLWPRLGKIIFRKRWEEFLQLRKSQEGVFSPLIQARKQFKQDNQKLDKADDGYVTSYVDSLLDFQSPDDKRHLDEGEIVSLCSEFLNAGIETTAESFKWVMANIVKHPHIQARLFEEINGVVGSNFDQVEEEDLQKMSYLKSVILEGLRRHPTAHFLFPRAVTKDVMLNGYLIPENSTVNFMVAEIAWDPQVWEDPLEFKPERFLNGNNGEEVFDITGTKEIKMMPFGVGRRMCPGYGLGMLHLEYFVANLVRSFQWTAVDGDDIDLTEKQELSVAMKYPLQAFVTSQVLLIFISFTSKTC